MFLTNLFKVNKKCRHERVAPDIETSYCPDCGELIRNDWYISRCACCGIKLKTVQRGEHIEPANRYCTNCGSGEFTIEKLDKINFIDINFAVLNKAIVRENSGMSTIQCWQGKTGETPRLLVQYL